MCIAMESQPLAHRQARLKRNQGPGEVVQQLKHWVLLQQAQVWVLAPTWPLKTATQLWEIWDHHLAFVGTASPWYAYIPAGKKHPHT